MKKKFNLFLAMVLAMTMLFGSTLCFAAEADNEPEVEEEEISTRERYLREENFEIKGSDGSYFKIHVNYGWDEGISGFVTSAYIVNWGNTNGMTASNCVKENNFAVVKITYKDLANNEKKISFHFRVDEYGSTSYWVES